ncbi:MAG: alpha-hydroxy-acid oxidizing enzyme [Phycisphaerae bacterium]|nr:alpha-hydroxy-acid oxidizing enzyme [Phycisphaerae bacterium]
MNDSDPMNLRDFEAVAMTSIGRMAFDYYAGGADDEITLFENTAAWGRARLLYRVLADVADRTVGCTVLGHELSMPVMAAPTAFHRMAHDEGELATVRATTGAGTAMILSSLSTVDVEDVLAAASGPVFFQLYLYKDREISRELIERVTAAGCAAIILTVDAPLLGNRERDEQNGFALPDGISIRNLTARGPLACDSDGGSGLAKFVRDHQDPGLRWEHLEWLRSITNLPIVLKGICRRDDAVRAFDAGASGIVVSNHGGRQLDTSPPTFEVLPGICEAVAGRGEVWVDGGIRRGTDVIKALACGATATLIGRPILWGLAADGQAGVERVWRIMAEELDLAMALAGCRNVGEITRDLVQLPGEDPRA